MKLNLNSKYPWVFYISVRKRSWFKNFYKSRGANYIEFQIFKFVITIGMPWNSQNINYASKNPSWYHSMNARNESFNKWYHIHIK